MLLLTDSEEIGVKGQNITLYFSVVEDEPKVLPASIHWYFHNGEDVLEITDDDRRFGFSSDQLSLTITNLSLSDEGTYAVNATNIIGTGSAEVFLDVESKSIQACLALYRDDMNSLCL